MNASDFFSNSSAIMSLVRGAIETTKMISDLWKSDKSASIIGDLNAKLTELHFKCMVQSEHVVLANERVSEAQREIRDLKEKIKEMTDEKAVLARFHPVRVIGFFNACVPNEHADPRDKGQILCAQCFCRSKIGVLNEVGNGHLDAGRGTDVVMKCSTCGTETKILRRALADLVK